MGIIDSTLREGEQMAGVYFSLDQKIEIVRLLGLVGIEEIELGVAVRDPEMETLLSRARSAAPDAKLSFWSRCVESDIVSTAALKPDVLAISIPVSDIHIEKRLEKDRKWILDQMPASVNSAKSRGVSYVSLGLEDATRADKDFLHTAFERAVAAGADRVRFSDTLGTATPNEVVLLAKEFVGEFDVELAIHTHNDFGMATANAITALDAGFDWADASVLGLGERSGIARLEELAAYLKIRKLRDGYNIAELTKLCETVAKAAGVGIYKHHPVIGASIFCCESGVHLDGIAKDPCTYEPYDPDLVSGARSKMIGKKIGRSALLGKITDLGVPVPEHIVLALLMQVRAQSRLMGRPLSENEIRQMAAFVGGSTICLRSSS